MRYYKYYYIINVGIITSHLIHENLNHYPINWIRSSTRSNAEMSLIDELHLIKASFKIFLIFLIFWTPVVIIILFFRHPSYHVPQWVYLYAALLAHSNSTCNFFVYYRENKAFRRALSRLVPSLERSLSSTTTPKSRLAIGADHLTTNGATKSAGLSASRVVVGNGQNLLLLTPVEVRDCNKLIEQCKIEQQQGSMSDEEEQESVLL